MDMGPYSRTPTLKSWDKLVYDRYHGTVVIYLGSVPPDLIAAAADFTALDELLISSPGFRRFLWQDRVISLTEESIRKNLVTPDDFKKRQIWGHTTTGS